MTTDFAALHVKGAPLVLVNVWDAGSASTQAAAGAKAVATGSWAVAAAGGYADGEAISLQDALGNLARIVAATPLPVTVDLERGYQDIAETVAAAARAGAVGANIEDGLPDGIRDTAEQADRLAAARAAAPGFFLNARTDHFLREPAERHAEFVDDAIERAQAYQAAGADGFFVPGLTDLDLVERIVRGTALPVNVMASSAVEIPGFAGRGVARVSFGAAPYLAMHEALTEYTRACLGQSV